MCVDQDWTIFVGAMRNLNVHTINVQEWFNNVHQTPLFRAMSTEEAPKLKKLSMFLGTKSNDSIEQMLQSQQQLLNSLSGSLEDLSLTLRNYYGYMDDEPRLEFPTMTKLKTLTLRSVDEGMDSYSIVPIEPNRIPELQTLFIDAVILNGRVFVRSSFSSVQEVNFGEWDLENHNFMDDFDALREIGFLFPSLRKLETWKQV